MEVEVKNSTFGSALAHQAEQQQEQTTTDTTTTETALNNEQTVVTDTVDTTTETAAAQTETSTENNAEQEQQEENSSSFSFGDEFAAQEKAATSEAAAQPTFTSWKDALKAVKPEERKELFQELGFDEFALEFINYRANGGDPYQYLAAKSVDYNKVNDLDLLKQDIRTQNPNLSNEEVDFLLTRKYKLNEDIDEEEAKFGQLLLKQDAHSVRQRKMDEQSKFQIPNVSAPNEAKEILEQIQATQLEQQQKAEQTRNAYINHEATKALNESKRVAIDLGEGRTFNFNVDKPEILNNVILDGELWNKVITTPQGEPDVKKLQRITLAALNPNYEKDLVNYGISLGKKMLVEEGQNARRPNTNVAPAAAKQGVVVVNANGKLGSHLQRQ